MKIVFTFDEWACPFLCQRNANKEQVSISKSDLWLAATEDYSVRSISSIKGVIGIKNFKSTSRIKSFFVRKEFRNDGIGRRLLEEAILKCEKKRITAFCTEHSIHLFLKLGFKVLSKNEKTKISFVEKRK